MCLRDTASLDPYGRVAWSSRTGTLSVYPECLKVTRSPADHSTARPRHDGVIRIRVSGQIVKNSVSGCVASSTDVGTQRNNRFDVEVRTHGILTRDF
jgi:hypothetical protein